MRENGVREFPDPNAAGEFAYGIKRGSSLDPSSAWKKAIGACKDLQPPRFIDSEMSAEEQEERLEFAQCIGDERRDGPPGPRDPVVHGGSRFGKRLAGSPSVPL
jgi:hypothetical protein